MDQDHTDSLWCWLLLFPGNYTNGEYLNIISICSAILLNKLPKMD